MSCNIQRGSFTPSLSGFKPSPYQLASLKQGGSKARCADWVSLFLSNSRAAKMIYTAMFNMQNMEHVALEVKR